MKRHLRFTPLIMALALIALTAGNGLAALTAGTTISNQATVSYAESPTSVSSNSVDVTVNLVSGLAWIDSTLSPSNSLTVGNGGAVSYSVDLHNTGNGTTLATISYLNTDGANLTAGSAWAVTPSNPTLYGAISSGAGVYAAGPNETTIPVDYHDVTALSVGDRVMINGNPYTIVAGSTATQLVVGDDASDDVGAAGVQIGEVLSITFSGNAGTLQNGDLDENHSHSMTATDDVGGGLNADGNTAATDTVNSDGTDPWFTRVVAGALTVAKYSRNVTNPIVGGAALAYDGNTYYQTGVTGNSDPDGAGPLNGDTLEYLVVISNAGPGSATDVQMADTISAFLTLDATSVDIDKNGDGDFADAGETDAIANNAALWTDPLLTVFAGTGGDATALPPTGGTILGTAVPATPVVSAIRYQAVIQ